MGDGTTSDHRETLLQRTENTRARAAGHSTQNLHGARPSGWFPGSASAPPATAVSPPPTVHHCWYDGPHGRQPALLLGWRNVGGRYSGRVAVAAPEADGWAIVEMWVDQGLLSPVP